MIFIKNVLDTFWGNMDKHRPKPLKSKHQQKKNGKKIMKKSAYVMLAYGLLIIVGGMIGFAKAHSMPSLIAGSTFGILGIISSICMFKNQTWSVYFSMGISALLTVFFAFRFINTAKFMPSGMMCVLSLIVLTFLILSSKKCCQLACKKNN